MIEDVLQVLRTPIWSLLNVHLTCNEFPRLVSNICSTYIVQMLPKTVCIKIKLSSWNHVSVEGNLSINRTDVPVIKNHCRLAEFLLSYNSPALVIALNHRIWALNFRHHNMYLAKINKYHAKTKGTDIYKKKWC